MLIGNYNKKIEILGLQQDQTDAGGVPKKGASNYQSKGSMWCAMETQGASERLIGKEDVQITDTEFRTHLRTDLDHTDQLLYQRWNRQSRSYREERYEVEEVFQDGEETVIRAKRIYENE